jgi:hypothetical protein
MLLDGVKDPPALVNKGLARDFKAIGKSEFHPEKVLGNHAGRFCYSSAKASPDAVFQAALDQVVYHLPSFVLMIHGNHEQVQILAQTLVVL